MDERLRALERAALLDGPAAEQQLAAELERSGALEAFDRDVEALLARVQPPDAVWPTTSKLDAAALASAAREVAGSSAPTCRVLIAEHHFRSPTASPEGTYAAIVLHDDRVIVGVDRGDTRVAAAFEADLAPSDPRSALGILGGPARQGVLRAGRATALAWSRLRLRRARLEAVEQVRRRPAMYVGDTRERGARALAGEVLDRAVELFAAGRCQGVRVRLLAGGACSVDDDGPGISSAVDERTGSPLLEVILTDPRRDDDPEYPVTGGLHGLGLWVVNALSAWLEVESRQGGVVVRQRFERGQPVAPPVIDGSSERTGLTVTFLPDPTIFAPSAGIGSGWLSQRLRELCFVNAGFRATLEADDRPGEAEVHCAEQGAVDALLALVGGDTPLLSSPVVVRGREAVTPGGPPVIVEAALTWTRRQGERIEDHVNSVRLTEGGPHLTALRAAVTRTFSRLGGTSRRGVSYGEGLVAFVSLKVPEPQYEGCTRTKLANREVGPIVGRLVARALARLVDERPDEARTIVSQALARSRGKRLPRAR